MKVAQLHGPRDIRIANAPDPTPGPHEVVLKVAFTGLCGTDLHQWEHPLTDGLPRIMGHEYSGTVMSKGSQVAQYVEGDRVAVNPYVYCARCFYCRRGMPNFCRDRKLYYSGWAEYVAVDARVLYPLPAEVSLELAALAEPLAACLHALDLADLQTGSDICIVGGGPIGLGVLALARAGGAAKIIVSEPSEYRRSLAARMGADIVVDPRADDLAAVVSRQTGGVGVSAAFECVTHSRSMQQAIEVVHNGGTVLGVGNASPEDRLALDLNDLHRRGISLRGSFSRAFSFERVVRLLPKLNLGPLLTHQMQLDAVTEAMNLARVGVAGKVLMTP